jgi:potassium efflux system protein
LADVWRFEITTTEDRSITVGKIGTGIIVFTLGLLLAHGFTNWFAPRVLSRVGLDEGAVHAYQSLGYYALLAILFVTALHIADIPLTAFAVLGGALAIGVGFGSQNIVNNFISGLILLAERPIKLGDLVELEGTYGNVERIGLRSTRVRTGDNIHVIVPNSAFLENRVINWSHNNRQVRISVSVGVAYGSPTRAVEKLFLQAIQEHPRVQENPEPTVLFTAFGDNSLEFEARFWVVIKSLMARRIIESEIRFRIDELFREAGIVIAFPQRDVHLDAATPIQVRLINGRNEAETEG